MKILIISESQNTLADQMIDKFLKKFNVEVAVDWKIYVVNKGEKSTTKQINVNREYILNKIKELKPEKIIVLGSVAFKALYAHRMSTTGFDKIVGSAIPDQDLKTWVFPVYNPLFLFQNKGNAAVYNKFNSNIQMIVEHNKEFPDYSNDIWDVILLKELISVNNFLQGIREGDVLTIDFETTGLKPYKKGHEIVCISIFKDGKAFVFPIFDDKRFLRTLKKIFENDRIFKIAHNMKYETIWAKQILGIDIKGWLHDSMIMQRVLNNTSLVGLKPQTMMRYGVIGYDDGIKKFIQTKTKDSHEFNKIKEAPIDDVMTYCGLDTIYTNRLYEDQKKETKYSSYVGYNFFHAGIITLAEIEQNGIQVNNDYFVDYKKKLEQEVKTIYSDIQNSNEVKQWHKQNGLEFKEEFNPKSSTQLRKLLFKILNYTSIKDTPTGMPSTDQSTLEEYDDKFVQLILKYRRYLKIKDTYVEGFIRETVNDKINTNFNLHTVVTYRSSSTAPNFQNIPVRNKELSKIIRTGITPSLGNQLLEVDYSGIEVRIAACYNQDPSMLNYINDPTTDMHRDVASEIFIMENTNVTKDQRYLAKNGFVFPQFYGDYYVNCAKNIWSRIDKETKKHLRDNNIKGYRDFEKHIQDIEYKFWNVRFPVYSEWKDKSWESYLQKGYIRLKTGFICQGIMNKKEVTNYPIQGSAFHCLLWSLIKLNEILKNYRSCIVGQIHDSIIFDMYPPELEELKPIIRSVMTIDIRKEWKWITVPLDIEADITEIDGNWYDKKNIEI